MVFCDSNILTSVAAKIINFQSILQEFNQNLLIQIKLFFREKSDLKSFHPNKDKIIKYILLAGELSFKRDSYSLSSGLLIRKCHFFKRMKSILSII